MSATPMPRPASAPGERELLFDLVAERPVPVDEAELLVSVTGLRVSEAAKEVDGPEEADVPEETDVPKEDEAGGVLCVENLEEEEEEEETAPSRLHLTVADWLKLLGHYSE